MKSGAYVSIEAHVLQCRLHHNNALTYSVSLKSGKNQQVSTPFKAATNLLIDMDTRLSLLADKHSFEQFPKVSVIVSLMGENKQSHKTVGSTFANYRKEGIQTFQISQCSCKDKAFEVDISFTTKVIEPKSSNTKSNKNQYPHPRNSNYLSHQATPRASRERNTQLLSRPQHTIRAVRSEKILNESTQAKEERGQSLVQTEEERLQVITLSERIMRYEEEIDELKRYKKMLFEEQLNCEKWFQLLKLEEEKNSFALAHIATLQQLMLNFIPKDKSFEGPLAPFRAIQEEDQILLINEQLQSELQKQRKRSQLMAQQIEQLKEKISTMAEWLKQTEQLAMRSKEQKQVQPSSFQNKIMVDSRHTDRQNSTQKEQSLRVQISLLEVKCRQLKQEIENLELTKRNLLKDLHPKVRADAKKPPTTPAIRSHVPPSSPKKPEKAQNKEKVPKIPVPKGAKKYTASSSSSDMGQVKKVGNVNKSESVANKKTEVQSEAQSKTEGESVHKSSQLLGNERNSEGTGKVVNELMYLVNTFQQQLHDL